jgi:hypothetical protein
MSVEISLFDSVQNQKFHFDLERRVKESNLLQPPTSSNFFLGQPP